MKQKITLLVTAIAAFVLLSTSCKKDNTDPDYVGTWVRTDVSDGNTINQTLTLTVDAFDLQAAYSGILILEIKGTLSVSGKAATMKITEINQRNESLAMVTYKEGTTEFNARLKEYGFSQTQSGEYAVSGSTLTLKTDENGDGKITEDEIQTFTKK